MPGTSGWTSLITAPAADTKAKAKPMGRPKGKNHSKVAPGERQMSGTMKHINVNVARQATVSDITTGLDDTETYQLPGRE